MKCPIQSLSLRRATRLAIFVPVALMLLALNGSLYAQGSATPKEAPAKKRPAKKKRTQNPRMAPITDVPGLPRVLLIGDSISISYTLEVRAGLKGKANVHRPPTNCGATNRGLADIDKWLGDGEWDLIHFNWGLHDLKYMGPNGQNLADPTNEKNHQQVPPKEYEENLRKLVKRLKETNAKLIWRNTTPVPAAAAGRVTGDSAIYNEIAAAVMKENKIPIHDAYAIVKPQMEELMLPKGNVHFNKKGSQVLADDIVALIEKTLNSDSVGSASKTEDAAGN